MNWIDCESQHLEAIRGIFNEAILHSTALYDYEPRSPEVMAAWWDAKQKGSYPVIGVVNDSGELMGFASYGPFRSFPAYKYTVEHSVYVDARFRSQGLGKRLLQRLLQIAQDQGYHVLVGVIDAANEPSVQLHERLGFTRCGELREVGFKFGRWLDLVIYQRQLPTPAHPVDG